jgi:hypothetical protein
MVPIEQPKVALQHPTWGDVSLPTPGAEGTALPAFVRGVALVRRNAKGREAVADSVVGIRFRSGGALRDLR